MAKPRGARGFRFFGAAAGSCDPGGVPLNKELSSNIVLLVLRVVVGGNMAWLHGWEKLHRFSAKAASFPDAFGVGSKYALTLTVAGEFFGALLMATGLLGRVGAFLVAVTAGVTLFATLQGTSWQSREVWALYFAASVTVLLLGCGRFSLDPLVWKRFGKGGGKGGSKGAAAASKR
jgi:putative oxidoreductase